MKDELWQMNLKYVALLEGSLFAEGCERASIETSEAWWRQVWGYISANSVADLVGIKGFLCNEKNRQTFIHHLMLSGWCMFGSKLILHQDNDPKYTDKVIKNYLQHIKEQ